MPPEVNCYAVPMMLLRLARDPLQPRLHPEDYLKAAGEMLFFLFAVSWALTLMFNPDLVANNPLKDRIGYNNVCVGFDSAPAVYVAQVLWAPTVYFGIRFAWSSAQRSALLKVKRPETRLWLSYLVSALFMASTSGFGLVFILTPDHHADHVWGHSIAFLQYIFARFAVVAVSYSESPKVSRASWAFLGAYGLASVVYPALIVIDYVGYDATARSPVIPWWITMSVDYLWFACLPLTTLLLPARESIRAEWSIAE